MLTTSIAFLPRSEGLGLLAAVGTVRVRHLLVQKVWHFAAELLQRSPAKLGSRQLGAPQQARSIATAQDTSSAKILASTHGRVFAFKNHHETLNKHSSTPHCGASRGNCLAHSLYDTSFHFSVTRSRMEYRAACCCFCCTKAEKRIRCGVQSYKRVITGHALATAMVSTMVCAQLREKE